MKLKTLRVLFLFLAIQVFAINTASSNLSHWNLVRQDNKTQVWELKSRKDVIGTFQMQTRDRPIDWSKIKTKSFFTKVKSQKQKMLSLIGITNWTVSKSQWTAKRNHHELIIKGSYQNRARQIISFYEVHLFYKHKTYQILVSHSQKVPLSLRIISQFVSYIKKRAVP